MRFVRWDENPTFGTNRVSFEFEHWKYLSLIDASIPREDEMGLWIDTFKQGVLEWRAFDLIPQALVLPLDRIGLLRV